MNNENFDDILKLPDQCVRIVKSAVGAHLINPALTDGFHLYYWQDRNNEVDFILEKKGHTIGQEVTTSETHKWFSMQAFQNLYHPEKVLMVGISGIPWQDFMAVNPELLF